MTIKVKSFTDRAGNKVFIGDTVGYFHVNGEMRESGKVVGITKAGYFISIFTEGRKHPWFKNSVRLLNL